MRLKHFFFMTVLVLMSALCTACATNGPEVSPQSESAQKQSAVDFYFDTVITISAYGTDEAVLKDAMAECAKYEKLLSKTIEGSDVWRINHSDGAPVTVDAHTANILRVAQDVSVRSGGMFDITIAPAMALWDFTGKKNVVPQESELRAAVALVDYRKLALEGNTVKLPAGMMIDLGGIAKGYIADQIALYLKARGVKNAMLNFGGNLVVMGEKPDGSAFVVGVQNPQEEIGTSSATLFVKERSAVTSGIYERGFDLDGMRYFHLLDPRTGMPAQNELASVTILSESSIMGDALSTACFVLGYEKALDLLSTYEDVDAVFVFRDGTIKVTDEVGKKYQFVIR